MLLSMSALSDEYATRRSNANHLSFLNWILLREDKKVKRKKELLLRDLARLYKIVRSAGGCRFPFISQVLPLFASREAFRSRLCVRAFCLYRFAGERKRGTPPCGGELPCRLEPGNEGCTQRPCTAALSLSDHKLTSWWAAAAAVPNAWPFEPRTTLPAPPPRIAASRQGRIWRTRTKPRRNQRI